MAVVHRIAFRNLTEHKTKTIIIGSIIAVGIMVLVVGNSFMDTATAGIRKMYIDNYTGHVVVKGTAEVGGMMGMMSAAGLGGGLGSPTIPEYDRVIASVERLPGLAAYTSQASAVAMLKVGEEDTTFAQLYGIESASYRAMFPDNIRVLSGEFLKPGEEGILLSAATAGNLKADYGIDVAPGDTVLLTSMFSAAGVKIREVTVRGVFEFKNADVSLSMVSLVDIDNVRALNGMTVGVAVGERASARSAAAPADDDELFGGGGQMIDEVDVVRSGNTEAYLDSMLGDLSNRGKLSEIDSGAWNTILIKLGNESQGARVIRELNSSFQDDGIAARATDWLDGAGATARIAYVVKNVFNVLILIVAVVAVIIIMNTLVISVTERIAEIGTMRAIGATKGFVREMIVSETVFISGIFGLVGVAAGAIVLAILSVPGIRAPNFFFQVIFGGEVLRPVVSLSAILTSLVVVAVVGVVAALYPVRIALKIQPVKAMQTE